jgi:serine/threonine-protein kinase
MVRTDELFTVTTPGAERPPDTDPGRRQFLPGTRLGKRYRIVELLGRGGTGEVYRADDLQLGLPVALKFLPAHLAHDPAAVAGLRNEVRVARQVSHPNVCRVYDLGEEEGQLFLSMEFVDGEDLASVLRRLGRPTHDKSLQIARQLCAGLAAAHESGVLHRDLKPANVMIDGRGNVRITDFGLAGFARELQGAEAHGGTPGYMAPEQLEGRSVSTRSDLYALGLVLYELFTGRRAFDAESISDLRRQYRSAAPPPPSTLVRDLDAEVERVVLRCLQPAPERRPLSARAVAAALSSGDPLAEALASGDTPSPEMVAAAGGRGGLRPAVAIACLAITLAGIAALAVMNDGSALFRIAGPEKPPGVLADRAREILVDLGRGAPPTDSAHGFREYWTYLNEVAKEERPPGRWTGLGTRRPEPYYFWYRESPVPLVPVEAFGTVTLHDPPPKVPGMAEICLDGSGRLRCLEIVPPQLDTTPPTGQSPNYSALFAAAGLDLADFIAAEPEWTPSFYADERQAWIGRYPDQAEPAVRIEAASYRGSPVYFEVLHPFDQPWRAPRADERSALERAMHFFYLGLVVAAAVGAVWIARRNMRSGRGDRIGALRLGLVVLALEMVHWVLVADHVPSLKWELVILAKALGIAVLVSIWTACAYLALEPYVRRLWPRSLISWTRLLRGRYADPRVGRDVLVGALAGTIVVVLQRLEFFVPGWLGAESRGPFSAILDPGRRSLAHIFDPGFLVLPLFLLLLLAGLLFLLRRRSLAIPAAFLVMVLVDEHWKVGVASDLAVAVAMIESVLVWTLLWFVLIRFGLLATVVCCFFYANVQRWPLTLDTTAWYGVSSFLLMVVLAAIALYAFRTSIAGREKLGLDPGGA